MLHIFECIRKYACFSTPRVIGGMFTQVYHALILITDNCSTTMSMLLPCTLNYCNVRLCFHLGWWQISYAFHKSFELFHIYPKVKRLPQSNQWRRCSIGTKRKDLAVLSVDYNFTFYRTMDLRTYSHREKITQKLCKQTLVLDYPCQG